MKVGLIGKRSSGKTTLFEAVSGIDLGNAAALPAVNIGSVRVHDACIDELSRIFNPAKTTRAEFTIVDYNRSQDTSDSMLGSASLVAKYREFDALVIVTGVVDDLEFVKPELDDIMYELNMTDIMILDAKIQRMKKSKYDKAELQLYENIISDLEGGKAVPVSSFSAEQIRLLSSFQLFALKPRMLAVNVTEDLLSVAGGEPLEGTGLPGMMISAEIERELKMLPEDEQEGFLKELGISESAASRFVNMVYKTLDLISFYTVGSDEVKAWSVRRGTTARVAAGKIHSDIERGFIRAETIHYDTFMEYGDEIKAKAAGAVRSEGKDYIVNHGDIIHYKFNV
ncbi:MAG: redox-regulated ATPase YchF [Oligoflexia bacterium]|nr:redox-regulated ATPase YchF [Oligoflexia bacterium]